MSRTNTSKLYKTNHVLKRKLRVAYPAGAGRVALRTELDWEKSLEAIELSADGNVSTFELEADQPFLYCKPCLIRGGETLWSVGANHLVLMSETDQRLLYPYFTSPEIGRFTKLIEEPSKILNRTVRLRAYLPPGYDENTLKVYPVAYMQDGQNLFFPDEAFMGQDWNLGGTGDTLRVMRAADDVIILGIHSDDRMKDYTRPGYETYVRMLVEEIMPAEKRLVRGGGDRRWRSVWGSSLGGVVSFYAAWQHPESFGAAICMSSTFSHKDDLIERVLNEPTRDLGFYLDSGWPGDNYEVTMAMATALISRGWRYGHNLLHLSFPHAEHDERSWGTRLHLPMQFLYGAVARASRINAPVLGISPKPKGRS